LSQPKSNSYFKARKDVLISLKAFSILIFSPKVTNINDALGIKDGMAGSRLPLLQTLKGRKHDVQLSGKLHLRIISRL